jgi:hypothetical protein
VIKRLDVIPGIMDIDDKLIQMLLRKNCMIVKKDYGTRPQALYDSLPDLFWIGDHGIVRTDIPADRC